MLGAKKYGNFINGKWLRGESGEYFSSRNPAKPLHVLAQFPQSTRDETKHAIEAAEKAYLKWCDVPAPGRGGILLRVAQILRKKKRELGSLVTNEMGKVIAEGLGDVQEAIDIFEYMAGEGRRLYGRTTTSEMRDKFSMTIRTPVGIAGCVTPWNFPIAIPAWKISAALICGNSVVLKPSSDTPLCAAMLVEILHEAGVPPGVVNMVTGRGEVVGNTIVEDAKVRAVSFTGSRSTGENILKKAGVKRVGLELGGKNPIIVMDDADLRLAVEGIVWGAFGTTGQRCSAASRVIAHRKIRHRLQEAIVERARKLRVGYGMAKGMEMGPLVNERALEKSGHYCDVGKREGAKLLLGGERIKGNGYFFHPTVFSEVEQDMRIFQEEIFGPVLSIVEAGGLNEAIELANSVEYGLTSSIYTKDINNAFKAITQIEAGLTYVNSSTIGSEAHLPFGGVKGTGNGTREAGMHGIDEFSEIKTVYVDFSGKLQRATIDD